MPLHRMITADSISDNLYTSASPPLDILIRTSGVNRLSDFLLWQVSPRVLIPPFLYRFSQSMFVDAILHKQANESTVLHFITPNWPDIGLLDICPPLLTYQAEVVTRSIMNHVCGLTSWFLPSQKLKLG